MFPCSDEQIGKKSLIIEFGFMLNAIKDIFLNLQYIPEYKMQMVAARWMLFEKNV